MLLYSVFLAPIDNEKFIFLPDCSLASTNILCLSHFLHSSTIFTFTPFSALSPQLLAILPFPYIYIAQRCAESNSISKRWRDSMIAPDAYFWREKKTPKQSFRFKYCSFYIDITEWNPRVRAGMCECLWYFPFISHPTECKLSRSGPPATIVAIDEESPNGKVLKCFTSLFVLHINGLGGNGFKETPVHSMWQMSAQLASLPSFLT